MPINQPHTRSILLFQSFFLIFLAGCVTTGTSERTPAADSRHWHRSTGEQIDHLLADTLFPPSNAGIMVYSLSQREILYAHNESLLFNPGSSQKVITAAAALASLGTDYEFSTDVFIDSTHPGRITVRGAGDPLLTSEEIDSIARVLAATIDHSATWNLIADVTAFDSLRMGKGWMWDDEPFVSPIGALCVNGNDVGITIRPGSHIGEIAIASLEDSVGSVVIENTATTAAWGLSDSLVFIRSDLDSITLIRIGGSIASDTRKYSTEIGVSDPALFWLSVLSEKLSSLGIATGTRTKGKTEEREGPLFSIRRDIDSVLHRMLKESHNLSAENMFRVLAHQTTGEPGSTEGAIVAVENSLSGFGIDTSAIVVADGSGVSRYNLVTAKTIVRILEAIYDRKEMFSSFFSALPVAGIDGTLSTRMKGTRAEGNLRAKTGTLRGASSLSGYVRTADGELLAFCILMQNFSGGPGSYRAVQDSIGALLSNLRRELQ